jgi:Fur family ferric uptake transcriptional regulator
MFCYELTGRSLPKRVDDQTGVNPEALHEAKERFHRHIKKVGLKQTEQRDLILETFVDTRDHMSVDELFRLVRERDPKIGITTVYRTLKLLAECGLASEVSFQDGVARYEHQVGRRSHHHMVCTECGSSVEFFSPQVDKLEGDIGREFGFQTRRHTFQIYGVCQDCQNQSH